MYATAKQQKRQEKIVSSLNVAITALDIAEKVSSIAPAKAAFSIVKEILAMIKVRLPYFALVDRELNVDRTLWRTRKTTSNSGWPARMSV